MKIPISINGRKFPVDWAKDSKLNIFTYDKFKVKGEDCNLCFKFVRGYINLHQEFIQPNGQTELKKTIEFIVGEVYKHIFPKDIEYRQNGKEKGLVYSY